MHPARNQNWTTTVFRMMQEKEARAVPNSDANTSNDAVDGAVAASDNSAAPAQASANASN
jgi:hypothetical protein